jgi:chemotaxis methyl-accepting protein methylase
MTQLKILLGNEIFNKIESLYKKIGPTDEFEISFFTKNKGKFIGQNSYIHILKYMKFLSKTHQFELTETQVTLDLFYDIYRITIYGEININKFTKKISEYTSKNFLIIRYVLMLLNKSENKEGYDIISKIKERDNIVDIDDFDMRVRLSTETDLYHKIKSQEFFDDLLKKLSYSIDKNINEKIYYRYKERVTLYLNKDDDKNYTKIDLTFVKDAIDIKILNNIYPHYELEIESVSSNADIKRIPLMLEYAEKLTKILQQSNYIISNSTSQKIINTYKSLLSINMESHMLVRRDPVSLEIQHVTEMLPDKYAVTDKADGDRNFLIITNGSVYLIGTNLQVKDLGIELSSKLATKYNGSIMDGEYIFISSKNRHLFMTFDCLRNGETDLRKNASLLDRLKNADQIINDCFIFGKQSGYSRPEPPKDFSLEKIIKFNEEQIKKYMINLNDDILLEKKYPLIRRKYFIEVTGAKKWEIFSYSALISKMYKENKCPYMLDGLIYHPLDQAYVTSSEESKYPEYKWKPPSKNSVDFYITFKRDPISHKIMPVYDNSNEKYIKNKLYKICNLFVGKKYQGKEQPVLFHEDLDLHEAYLFITDGEARDIEGNIITNETVVEFYYNNDENVPPKFRWVPLRTRYDKTESVRRFSKRYGNYVDTAYKVWRSIINPVTMDDFIELAKGNIVGKNMFYDNKINELKGRIEHKLIISVTKENKYYQAQANLSKPMDQFHNWIKSNIIYTYCNQMYRNKKLSILDYGCGRGGDIMKYYYATVDFVVGIDIDKETLMAATNGPISRYNQLKKTHPNFPRMFFINADGGNILDYDTQSTILGGMDNNNKKLFLNFFSLDPQKRTMFDRINCQFVIHYFLKDNTSWKNFKENVNMYLKKGGYLMLTTFDAKKVVELLKDNDKYTTYYTDKNGNEKIFFELVKRYEIGKDGIIGTGHPIDLHASWMFAEGRYVTEYLVDSDFLMGELYRDCNLEIADTDSFMNQFEIHREFFEKSYKYESVEKTRGTFSRFAEYYKPTDINKNCYVYSGLTRYYVFRKRE